MVNEIKLLGSQSRIKIHISLSSCGKRADNYYSYRAEDKKVEFYLQTTVNPMITTQMAIHVGGCNMGSNPEFLIPQETYSGPMVASRRRLALGFLMN